MERAGFLHAVPPPAGAVDTHDAGGGIVDRSGRSPLPHCWVAGSRRSLRHVSLPRPGERAPTQLLGLPGNDRWGHADTILEKRRHHGRIANDCSVWCRQVVVGQLVCSRSGWLASQTATSTCLFARQTTRLAVFNSRLTTTFVASLNFQPLQSGGGPYIYQQPTNF